MNKKLLDVLVCPVCSARLRYNRKTSELECRHDQLAFPVREGVPILLAMDARPLSRDRS